MNIKWDADKYSKDFSFVHQYGNDVTQLIEKKEGYSVLDLGCGNGALTKKLSDDGLSALGMDASPELLSIAKSTYPDIMFIEGDATDFKLPEKVDIVFSNAVFHWIAKENHYKMLNCVYNSLQNNGQFVFEFGGFGNNALIHRSLEKAFTKRNIDYKMPFYFPTIGEYSTLLEKAGFKVVYATLFDRLTQLNGEDGLYDWINLFVKEPFKYVSLEEKESIVRETVDNLRSDLFLNNIWFADYVRIRCKAIKEEGIMWIT